MATSIGAVNCDMVKGIAPTKRSQVGIWRRPGVNSPGAHILGKAGQFEFLAVEYAAFATVLAWAQSIEALIGTVVTITDDWGNAWANCLITERTSAPRIKRMNSAAGNARGEIVVRGEIT